MDRIKIEPTEMALWYELIREAEHVSDIMLEEASENYLVMLLMRFITDRKLTESVLAMDFLEAQEQSYHLQKEQLQCVGDKCLLYSGLFPKVAEKKRVKISYFIDLGRNAYYQVAGNVPSELQPLYFKLCQTFTHMRDVLQTTRELQPNEHAAMSHLAALELWQDTGSRVAYQTLQQHSDSAHLTDPPSRKQ